MSANYLAQYDRPDRSFIRPILSDDDYEATFKRGAGAIFRFTRDEGTADARTRGLQPFIEARKEQIRTALGNDIPVRGHYIPSGQTVVFSEDNREYQDALELVRSGQVILDGEEVSHRSKVVATNNHAASMLTIIDPELVRELLLLEMARAINPDIMTDEEIEAKVSEEMAVRREANQRVMARSSALSLLAGGAAAVVTDPVIAVSLAIPGIGWQAPGRGIIMNMLRGGASEFLIGAAAEAAIQGEIYQWKKALNSPYEAKDVVFAILAAGVGGFAIRGTASVAIDTFLALKPRSPAIARALEDAGVDPQIVEALQANIRILEEARPPGVTPEDFSRSVEIAAARLGRGESIDDLPLPEGTALQRMAERQAEMNAAEIRVMELTDVAEQALTRADRATLNRTLRAVQEDLDRVSSPDGLRAIYAERVAGMEVDSGLAKFNERQAKIEQKKRVGELQARVSELEAQVKADKDARAAGKRVTELRGKLKADKADAKKVEGLKVTRVGDPPTPLQRGINEAMTLQRKMSEVPEVLKVPEPRVPDRTAGAAGTLISRTTIEGKAGTQTIESRYDDAGNVVRTTFDADGKVLSREPAQAKPRVDKGDVPPDLRAPRGAEEAPPPSAVPEEWADIVVPSTDDGRLVTLRQELSRLDDEMAAMQRVDNCVRGKA